MRPKIPKGAVVQGHSTLKEVMRAIDASGLRVAYVTDPRGRVLGSVSDGDLRRAILRGGSVNDPVGDVLHRDPVVLAERDLADPQAVRRTISRLLERIPEAAHLLVVDADSRPVRTARWGELLDRKQHRGGCRHGGRNVLVVGGAGYLGSVLAGRLLDRGFKVRVLDILTFGSEPLRHVMGREGFTLVEGDARNITTLSSALRDVDAVINLSAVVGDPACKNKPEAAIETNYLANKVLAEACRYHQINRFIYASTCSVYGQMDGKSVLDEEAPLNPVSLYARSKIQAEEGILSLVDENFRPTILRMGTLYGYSPRMRFDLVVNTMTKTALVDGSILVHGGGKQWRPLLHVEDAAEAYIRCLTAPLGKVGAQTFNVGSSDQNFRIIEIAKVVHASLPKARLIIEEGTADPRDYCVSFEKIAARLRYRATDRIRQSVRRITAAIERGEIRDVSDPRYYNVELAQ